MGQGSKADRATPPSPIGWQRQLSCTQIAFGQLPRPLPRPGPFCVLGCAPVNMQQDFYLNVTPFLNQIPTPGREPGAPPSTSVPRALPLFSRFSLAVVLSAFNFHLVYFNVIFNSSVFS